MRRLALIVAVFSTAACGQDDEAPEQFEFGGDRPVFLDVPSTYDHATPTPLLVFLHGYGGSAFLETRWSQIDKLVQEQGLLLLAPDGTVDSTGKAFWNAFPPCCDGRGDPPQAPTDDVAYLGGLVEDVSAVWNVDPKRIYFMGHSNGGWMSYRMACDRADLIAAIVPTAGALYTDPTFCQPSEAVSALHVHGTVDEQVPYQGDDFHPQPGAVASLELWAGYTGCTPTRSPASPAQIDIESTLEGAETRVEQILDCPEGIGHELWTVENGTHTPAWSDSYHTRVYEWLLAHPKP